MATHSSILAWRIPWTEEPGESRGQRSLESYSLWGKKSWTRLSAHTHAQFNDLTDDYPQFQE